MATIFQRKGRPSWYISYFLNGKRITESLGTNDRTIAKKKQKKREVEIDNGTHQVFGKQGIDDLVAAYKASKGERKEQTNSVEFYLLDSFIESMDKKNIDTITESDILSFLKARYSGKAAVSYNNAVGVIKRFFAFAVRKRKLDPRKDPTFDLERKKVVKGKPTFFTDEEYLRIEKAAEGSPIYSMIVTARYTGLRLAELLHLEWEDFDWREKQIHVRNKPKWNYTIKTYEERGVPLCAELMSELLPYRKSEGLCWPVFSGVKKGSLYSRQGPKDQINAILADAGLKESGEGWHKFRRTYASRLVQKGVSIEKVSKWLGHSTIGITEKHYACFAPKYDKDIEQLNIRTADQSADQRNSRKANPLETLVKYGAEGGI